MQITEALEEHVLENIELLRIPEGRRLMTKDDPLLFAYVYFPEHLRNPTTGDMTICDFHLDLLDWAKGWMDKHPIPKQYRACFIAPRSSGKSTWIFLLLPMWAAAHGHRKFVAAFSDSETQAVGHLYTFKQELETNELLREDYPELCEPFRTTEGGRAMMDNRGQTRRGNGFTFMAKGADSAALGLKVGAVRPDVLLFDDIEPGESNYSQNEANKRKTTLLDDLFPINIWGVVGIVGTTTMPNSLIDQMRKVQILKEEYEGESSLFREALDPEQRWVLDEQINVHYWPAILEDEDGTERALWPEKWSMDDLNNMRSTRSFQKNMMNRPVSEAGGYWNDDDIDIDRPLHYGRTLLSIDPAVTTAKRSDYTGLVVASVGSDKKIYIRYAEQVKLDSQQLADKVTEIINEYGVGIAVVETNQGGDLWKQVFKNIPCKLRTMRQSQSKEIRAEWASDYYKRGLIKHTEHFPSAEEQMLSFPHVIHDDLVDAISTAVLSFTKYAKKGVGVLTRKYMEV